MPMESRSNNALFRREEQLKRWQESETNQVSAESPKHKKIKIKFGDGCVFLAACSAGDTEEVEQLLQKGTDINTTNVDGLTALHQACIDNNYEMVKFLVEHGCDLNRGDNEGWTPLHATSSCGFLSIAEYLIEHGAEVDAVNNEGDLPIDIAESEEMEKYLSSALSKLGIDREKARGYEKYIMLEHLKNATKDNSNMWDTIQPRTGATPLHVAASKGYLEVISKLIELGVDINAQDNDGWTPLHAAVHWMQKDVCRMLADNLANMDIQNFAGQSCFDIADPEVTKLLVELKIKQESMQLDRPDIQAILQRTSSKPPLKRRTSVTRMSVEQKSKSVMKDTKAERAQIENLTLTEEDIEDDKEKSKSLKPDLEALTGPLNHKKSITINNEAGEVNKVPSWKAVIQKRSEENTNSEADISEVVIKRPKRFTDEEKSANATEDSSSFEGRSSFPPVRDDESESQRKAHAKRVRETRRSTQGVLLEDVKSAELQYLITTQRDAANRQAGEANQHIVESNEIKGRLNSRPSDISVPNEPISTNVDSKDIQSDKIDTRIPTVDSTKKSSDKNDAESPSVTLVLKPKLNIPPDDLNTSENRASLATPGAIHRRRRPKRRSTGVVYLDSDDSFETKGSSTEEYSPDIENSSNLSCKESDQLKDSTSLNSKTGTSTFTKDSVLNASKKDSAALNETKGNRHGLQHSSSSCHDSSIDRSARGVNKSDMQDSKCLENTQRENERLKIALKEAEAEIEDLKQNSESKQGRSNKELDVRERRVLERKISELEEELKELQEIKTENERLKQENAALIRVISKLSK